MFIWRYRYRSRTGKPPECSDRCGVRRSHRHSFYGAGVKKSQRTMVWYATSRQAGYRMRDILLWKTAIPHVSVSQLLPLRPFRYKGIWAAESRLEQANELIVVKPRQRGIPQFQ